MIGAPPRYKRTNTPFPHQRVFRSPIAGRGTALSAVTRQSNSSLAKLEMATSAKTDRMRPACARRSAKTITDPRIRISLLAYQRSSLVEVAPGQSACASTTSPARARRELMRSEEHTSELQSLMRISYAVFCLKKKKERKYNTNKKITAKN